MNSPVNSSGNFPAASMLHMRSGTQAGHDVGYAAGQGAGNNLREPAHGTPNVRHMEQRVRAERPDHAGGSDHSVMEFLDRQRDVSDFLRAHRHSDRVRFLKVALPLTGVLVILLLAGIWIFSAASGVPEVSVGATEFNNGRMIMKNPELNGVDKQNRPYNLAAVEAIQDATKPTLIELNGITANVPMDEGLDAFITAGFGLYDSDAKMLKLGGEVDVKTKTGMLIQLQDADIDMEGGSLVTGNPVSMKSPQAAVSASRLKVEENGSRIVFEDRVRMTIYPSDGVPGGNQAAANSVRQE